MKFLSDDFMLKNKTARYLYKNIKDLPIIDYHCHISPKMIADNHQFKNSTELFLGGDHYKWRQMRTVGVDERYITGDADDYEKWEKFAETVSLLIGNPIYHWTHMELKKYFSFDEPLCKENAKKAWDIINKKLSSPEGTVRALIKESNVETICTTDAPYDTLEYHKALKDFDVNVIPAFRPNPYFMSDDITDRLDYFHSNGCRLADHAIDSLDQEMIDNLVFYGKEYAKRGWVWQLHIGAQRNNNPLMFEKLGPDTGFDSVNDFQIADGLRKILGTLEMEDALPKTIIYSLNPKDNFVIGTMLGCFQKGGYYGKIQFGSAWWFNDHRDGMEAHLCALANLGTLPTFIGMLTDSRSFVSYTRHDYFRRLVCNLLGKWAEEGEYPNNKDMLVKIASDISYYNAKNYFNF